MKFDKKFLQETYNKYFCQTAEGTEQHKKAIETWETYQTKINQKEFEVNDYTSTAGECLIKFLVYRSNAFVPCAQIRPNYWMLRQMEADTYYISKYMVEEQTIKEQTNASLKDAQDILDKKILPLLTSIVEAKTIDDLKKIEKEASWFPSGQLLLKMMVLQSATSATDSQTDSTDIRYGLPIILDSKVVDTLYDAFDLSEETTTVGKSYRIMDACCNLLGITVRDLAMQVKVSRFLWELVKYNMVDVSEESPNVIFYGSPGTGKTYTVKKAIQYLTKGDKSRAVFVQCHPGFGYEEFIEGLKPVGFTENGIKFKIVNGEFKELCIRAKDDPEHEYYFVADEINRANLSSMFGEVLSMLEMEYRDDPKKERQLIKTPLSKLIEEYIKENQIEPKTIAYEYDKNTGVWLGIPKNIRFIGMMNDVDKSIDSFDLALRRRFKWIRKDCDYDVIEEALIAKNFPGEKVAKYVECCKNLNTFISKKDGNSLGFGKAYEFGHAYYLRVTKITKTACEELFDGHLSPVLTEYIRSFKDEDEIDNVIEKARTVFLNPLN